MKMKRILALLCAAATLTLSCKKSSSEPAPGPESKDFTIEQTDLTQGSFGVRITPNDNEGTYYFNVISKEDFAKLYSSDSDKLTAAYKAWFEQIATANGLALQDILKEALLSGMQNKPYTALVPNTEYVFFVYGLNLDGNATTAVSYYEFKTLEPKLDETVTFNITPTEIKSTYFVFDIEPSNPDIFYFFDIMPAYEYEDQCANDPANIPSFVKTFITSLKTENDTFKAMSWAEFVTYLTKRGKCTYDTQTSETNNSLLPEYDYYVYAIGIANDGSFSTNPTVVKVTTGETPRNEYTVKTSKISDITYEFDIFAKWSEAFAVMMERAIYFEGETDEQMVADLVAANKGDISAYLFADRAKGSFTDLIPDEDYYVFIFACNTNGTPKKGEKANIVKVPIRTKTASPTGATYTIKVSNISKTTARVNVSGDDKATGQTFLLNYVTKAEFDAGVAASSEKEFLQKHMDAKIDASLKEWNESHAKLDRKEFLSRLLPGESVFGTGTYVDWEGLTAGTEYYAYVIGIKADGTYTTEPFKTLFKTIEEKKSKVSISMAMSARNMDEFGGSFVGQTQYNISADALPYASAGKLYTKAFTGTDEWAGKSSEELVALLLNETPILPAKDLYGYLVCQNIQSFNGARGEMFYYYAVAYDSDGIISDIVKTSHLSKAEGGTSGMWKGVKIDKTETIAVAR